MTNSSSPYNYSAPNDPPGTAANEEMLVDGKRLGLLPDQGLARIEFGRVFYPRAESIPIPNADDHIASVPAWNMGGNDRYSTCGPTSLANFLTMVYWNLLSEQVTVTDQAVFNLYRQVNPDFNPDTGQGDRGVDMVQLLKAFEGTGLEITHEDGSTEIIKPVAFGGLRADSLSEVKAATATLGGAILAVQLEIAQQSQSVWDYAPSPAWGGHAIMGAAYTGNTSGPDEEIITWQHPVGCTDNFLNTQMSQAFAVVLPVHLSHPAFLAGVDVNQLKAEYQELTGRPFPA